jgi:hypothetical protein
MSPLRRPARQIAATAALAAGLVLPTLGVAFHAWRIHQPGHVREHEQALSRLLGLHVRLGGVEYPAPGECLLREVILHREEAAGAPSRLAELARLPRVRLVHEGDTTTLHADEVGFAAASPADLADTLAELAPRVVQGGRVNLLVARVHLLGGPTSASSEPLLRDLAATLQGRPGEETLSVSTRWGDAKDAPRLELVAGRTRAPEGLLTDVQLALDDHEAPAAALGPWLDADTWFGPDATIQGVARFQRLDREPWQARFEGDIRGIDLDRLVAHRFPAARLAGRANLVVAEAVWSALPRGQGTGWAHARGRLEAREGAIGADLLRALVADLRFRTAATPPPDHEDLPFSRLALDFELDRDGQLRLGGALGPGQPADAVALAPGASLAVLRAPEGAASVRGLWKALFPTPADALVPATAENGALLRHLPLPPAGAEPVRAN